jgi:hypothetical protein
MIISPAFILCAMYLTYKIIQLSAILFWYLLVALWRLACWPFEAAAAHRRRRGRPNLRDETDPFTERRAGAGYGVSHAENGFSAKPILLDRPMSRTPGPGRPSKGERDSFFTRPATPVGKVIRANADSLGMPYGEYISACLAQFLGMTEYAPNPPAPLDQQELPLKTA